RPALTVLSLAEFFAERRRLAPLRGGTQAFSGGLRWRSDPRLLSGNPPGCGVPGRASSLIASGFTLIELLVAIVLRALLAGLLLPALSQAKGRAQAITCLSNIKQLSLAWFLYADENEDRLVNNHGKPETTAKRNTWANNVEDWGNSDDNINPIYLTDSLLGPSAGRSAAVFKCPSDRTPAANRQRIRSMSINAMVGDPDRLTKGIKP